MKRVLVTGVSGFIGYHLTTSLLARHIEVIGVDSLSASYGSTLPRWRWRELSDMTGVSLVQGDLCDSALWENVRAIGACDTVYHLAGATGVRRSSVDPGFYLKNNIEATAAVFRETLSMGVGNIIFASSSSVYGSAGEHGPTSEDSADPGLIRSFYAATKWSCETMARDVAAVSPSFYIGVRPFTVLGPMGRPDMALANFARQALTSQPIEIFGDGTASRDFTDVSFLCDNLISLGLLPPREGHFLPVNVAGGTPSSLDDLARCVEEALGTQTGRRYSEFPYQDATATYADTSLLRSLVDVGSPPPLELTVKRALENSEWVHLAG